ncbi:interleukin-13 receptor subunit alpha-1-like [Hyperolius riggenbachi]|uniref:interleukin-13 receptor subunit alpha-1-like n=1 Tax=Hyperolius riggenbachi TaxID=752182 RepID=UPI0035A36810
METCHLVSLLGLILSAHYLTASNTTENYNSLLPDDITFGITECWSLFWKWPPSSANCSSTELKYSVTMDVLSDGEPLAEEGKNANLTVALIPPHYYDLNHGLNFSVQVVCNDTEIDSAFKTVQVAPGDEGTAVRNFRCIWQYNEYVNCTWQHGTKTPLNVKYKLHYWEKENEEKKCSTLPEFWDILDTGKTCEKYFNDGKYIGCQFPLQKHIDPLPTLVTVVTDESKRIKPHISYTMTNNIAQFRPPTITETKRTPNNSIYVSWNVSEGNKNIITSQITSRSSSDDEWTNPFEIANALHKEIPNVLPDVTYMVKVRVRLSNHQTSNGDQCLWSPWSEEFTVSGQDNGRSVSILLLLLIPLSVIMLTILLLFHLKRLKGTLFPQIPDPAKIFPKDLQQWKKSELQNVYSKPEQEEVCLVYLIENLSATKNS